METRKIEILITSFLGLLLLLILFSCDSDNTVVGLGDGKERLLVIKRYDQWSEIGTMRPDGTGYLTLFGFSTSRPNRYIDYARLSPNDNLITFSGGLGDEIHSHSVWLADINGNLIDKISDYGRRPEWSYDGSKIYYTQYRTSETYLSDIYVYDFSSSHKIEIPPGIEYPQFGYINYYYWLEDTFPFSDNYLLGNELYEYIDGNILLDGDNNFFIFNLISREKTYITDSTLTGEGWANISPVDSLILFNSTNAFNGAASHLYQIGLQGNDIRELTDPTEMIFHAGFCWSPDGEIVAFTKNDIANSENPWSNIFLLDLKTDRETQITFEEDRSIGWYVMQWFENE